MRHWKHWKPDVCIGLSLFLMILGPIGFNYNLFSGPIAQLSIIGGFALGIRALAYLI